VLLALLGLPLKDPGSDKLCPVVGIYNYVHGVPNGDLVGEQRTYSTKLNCTIECAIENRKRPLNSTVKDGGEEAEERGGGPEPRHLFYSRIRKGDRRLCYVQCSQLSSEALNIVGMRRTLSPIAVPVEALSRTCKLRAISAAEQLFERSSD
jgi:hypothetical protein